MKQDDFARGVAYLGITILLWGGTWPIAKDAVAAIAPFWLGFIRYLIAPVLFVLVLLRLEGRAALSYDGRFVPAAILGGVGFAGYNGLAFEGLRLTTPEHVALISALQSPLTPLMLWLWRGERPARFTLWCILLAFAGSAIVVTKGDPIHAVTGGSLLGDLLVLSGAAAWVAYSLGMSAFKEWSVLRFTTLTSIPGGVALGAGALIAWALGHSPPPTPAALVEFWWQLSYLVLGTAFIGVLFWNRGVGALGPLNAGLAINLVPVVTFTIRVAQGYRFTPLELGGALLVIGALVANNLYLRATVAARGDRAA